MRLSRESLELKSLWEQTNFILLPKLSLKQKTD
jgi:hypothetical protein